MKRIMAHVKALTNENARLRLRNHFLQAEVERLNQVVTFTTGDNRRGVTDDGQGYGEGSSWLVWDLYLVRRDPGFMGSVDSLHLPAVRLRLREERGRDRWR